ncbi:hypothetical protein CCMA1212_003638 [Trichoderma ghanense]|uniref:Complex 1 LYR protein domain-containing protein n=1 Tax=Trichoderma ghanense TaxID=65468 RepID=A0ABY2HBL4_9HYPO
MRLSGLQKEVLSLYRQCLRECRKKPQETRAHFEKFVRDEFSRNLTIEKRDFAAIEFLLRKGHRQLDVYSSPGIKDVSNFLAIATNNYRRHHSSSTFQQLHRVLPSSSWTLLSMATLAAIPEAASTLLDRNRFRFRDSAATASFQRQRPKSRVVILSRRNSRAPTLIGRPPPPPTSPGSVYSSDIRRASEQHYAEVPPILPLDAPRHAQHDLRSTYDGATSYQKPRVRSVDEASSLDNAWEPSEPSIDLDTFPLPPVIRPLSVSSNRATPTAVAANPLRNPASTVPKPGMATSFANANFSPSNSRQKPHVCAYRSPRSSHSLLLDGAADFASASKHTSIDSALVEAISRSVCQQLSLFNAISKNNQEKRGLKASREAQPSRHRNHSSVHDKPLPPTAQAERRHGHPPRAKHPWTAENPPATPTRSSISLHTVSELMPFRPEFKAAGLAVTSKDQKRGFPAYIARLISSKPRQGRTNASRGKHSKVPGFDGTKDKYSSESSGTEISFAASQDMDEWRFALIDEAPVRKPKRRPAKEKKKKHKRRWLPCFPKDDESGADGDALSTMSQDLPPTPPPKPTPLKMSQRSGRGISARPRVDSIPRSPRHRSIGARDADRRACDFCLYREPATGEGCRGGRYDGRGSSHEHYCVRQHGRRAQTTQIPPARHLHSQAGHSYQRQYQSLPNQILNRDIKSSQPRPSFDPDHIGVCCRGGRGVSNQANAPPNVPMRTSSIRESLPPSEDDCPGDGGRVADRDVLRGLHIAASAACDEQVDAFVRNKTGLRIRRFLADLMVLETLRDGEPDQGHGQGARRKRAALRQLKQQVRRSRQVGGSGPSA